MCVKQRTVAVRKNVAKTRDGTGETSLTPFEDSVPFSLSRAQVADLQQTTYFHILESLESQ